MNTIPSSIFNDVIGPVMRGPSSSHVAGAARIAEIVRQSLSAKPSHVVCDFDPTGSLAESHTGHGTDLGFACGLMGISLQTPGVDRYEELANEHDLDIEYKIFEYGAAHPNNYRMHVDAADGTHREWEAISTGGGMIEMQKFEGFDVKIVGDFDVLLVIANADLDAAALESKVENIESVRTSTVNGRQCFQFDLAQPAIEEVVSAVKELKGVEDVVALTAILPTHSSAVCLVPFRNATELAEYAARDVENGEVYPAWHYAAQYEAARGNMTEEEVMETMKGLYDVMSAAVENGLAGTEYERRILPPQAGLIEKNQAKLLPVGPINQVIRCVTAVMESMTSYGVIVACPTVGSCGCVPGTLIGLGKEYGIEEEDLLQAFLVAGLVGVFFAEGATFAAEVGGCQVECGAASGMAAAAVASLMGGDIDTCMTAASIALQNITGLACDPIANRVEAPCLGKNVMAGTNAISAANMALAGYQKVIPLDETIGAILDIGLKLPLELRCTYGGLGKTCTANKIWERFK